MVLYRESLWRQLSRNIILLADGADFNTPLLTFMPLVIVMFIIIIIVQVVFLSVRLGHMTMYIFV